MSLSRPPTAAELLRAVAAARGWVVGNGLPDEARAGRLLLRDYTAGKLLYCEWPPPAHAPAARPAAARTQEAPEQGSPEPAAPALPSRSRWGAGTSAAERRGAADLAEHGAWHAPQSAEGGAAQERVRAAGASTAHAGETDGSSAEDSAASSAGAP